MEMVEYYVLGCFLFHAVLCFTPDIAKSPIRVCVLVEAEVKLLQQRTLNAAN